MNPTTTLALGRIAAGAGAFLAPSLTGSLLGIGGAPDSHLAARLFGGRDLMLGIGTLTFAGEQRRGVIRLGVACDVLDVAAAGLGLRQKSLPAPRAGLFAAVAGGAVVVGARALKQA